MVKLRRLWLLRKSLNWVRLDLTIDFYTLVLWGWDFHGRTMGVEGIEGGGR